MDKIKDVRRRLAALSTGGIDADSPLPATSLADCRVLQSRLRELKREVLARIAALRTEVTERSRESVRARPSMRGDWQRRKEDAKGLLANVQKRVIQLVDGKHGDALEAWSLLSEEIDARLSRLETLETRLTRVAGEDDTIYLEGPPPLPQDPDVRKGDENQTSDDDLYAATGAAARPPGAAAKAEDTGHDDNLYAAVGATAQQGEKADAYCSNCGKGHASDDRFCRRCGHRLEGD